MTPSRVVFGVFALAVFTAAVPHDLRPPRMDHAEESQMTPDGLNGLRALLDRARGGAFGPNVREVKFEFQFKGLTSTGAVRFSFEREGEQVGFLLLQPPESSTTRPFFVLPDDGVAEADTAILKQQLEAVFLTNPWAPPDLSNLPDERYRPVSRSRTLASFYFLTFTTIGGVLFLLLARRRPEPS